MRVNCGTPTQPRYRVKESVQKFTCKVCLKQWDMNYESMLEQLDPTPLPQRQKLL